MKQRNRNVLRARKSSKKIKRTDGTKQVTVTKNIVTE